MALYTYRALNSAGKSERGTLNAGTEKEARQILQSRNIFPLEIRASSPFSFNLQNLLSFSREPSLSTQDLAVFSRQFATLLEATIPYDTALDMIIQQTEDMMLKTVLADVKGKVVEGAYLADSMRAYPRVFPAMVVNMVRSGEASGRLTTIMHSLADYYENASRLKSKLTSAMVYPIFMMFFGSGVAAFMLTYIIPKITDLFENFGVQLPLPTRILIGLSDILTGFWWLIILLIGLSIWGIIKYLRTEQGQLWKDRLELRIPLWKNLRRMMILQRFSQTLATMLQSGVDLNDALAVSAQVMENKIYLEAMEHVIFNVQNKGLPLSVALQRETLFPSDMCQMIAIGEETAKLDAMLETMARRYSREITVITDSATALLEPVMILVMGAGVGFIVVSILLPLLQLNQLVK